MTTQSITNNLPSAATELDAVTGQSASGPLDVTRLAQLANELFSAMPSSTTAPNGLNLAFDDVVAPPHPPQPVDQFSALAGRGPSLVYQNSLNPEIPQHIPNFPDYPERRAVASAPLIGGANLPKVPFESRLSNIAAATPQSPTLAPPSGASPSPSAFYFLDEQSDFAELAPDFNLQTSQADLAKAFHLPFGEELSPLLKDERSPATASAAHPSSFYFLDFPQLSTLQSSPAAETLHFSPQASQPFDVWAIRKDFPILQEQVNGRPLVWFDNAATTQKPQAVIDRLAYFYQHENSNIHRAAHELAARASDAYEHARNVVARFIGAKSAQEIVFVRGTTEGINLIAKSWGEQNIGEGDEIIVSYLEHHANIVPWYQLSKKTGAKLKVIPVDDSGQIILEELPKMMNARTKLISITQVSNALGTVTPVAEVIQMAHARGIRVLVDGAQSVSHMPSNVQAIDADFFVFSGHKVFGPTGIGALYAKADILETMPVWEGGGNMIQDVSFEQITYQSAPNKFEAGTGNIADAVGLAAALEYVEQIGIQNIAAYEHALLDYGHNALASVPGLRLIGTALTKASVMSFTLQGFSTEAVGKTLNQYGIAVRSGHHCAQPILRRFGVEQTVRPSLAFYNTTEEIDLLSAVLHQLVSKRSTAF
jgi:cysteine desulfurase/selenocysteine lyase